MTDEDVQAIRERAQAAGNGAVPARLAIAHYLNDVERLSAEIDRLRRDLLMQAVRARGAEEAIQASREFAGAIAREFD